MFTTQLAGEVGDLLSDGAAYSNRRGSC